MSANNRRTGPGGLSSEVILLWVGIITVAVVIGGVDVVVRVGNAIDGTHPDVPSNPFEVGASLIRGTVAWPQSATAVLMGLVVALAAAVAGGGLLWRQLTRGRTRVDRASQYMGRGRDIAAMNRRNAKATAQRLGVTTSPGVPIGRTLTGGMGGGTELYGSWEDVQIDIWGPRTGKTTSRAIPAIVDAPGAVVGTSNKRDVVDATRDVRAKTGRVWIFDPQQIANEDPSWWWNPLSYVTDEVKAARLADHFASGSREVGARTDAFFDPAGQDLLAGLLLAAALADRSITQTYTWLTNPNDDEPIEILRKHDFLLTADQVSGVINAPDKQRGGIYGTAQQMASCLTNRAVARWVTPDPSRPERPHFNPHDFVRSTDTLYSLSREGRGTAGPLVTALTVAVVEAAEELAASSAGGRLPVPLLAVLDEAANVCRWRDLPDLYSHYGSRGIVLMTILQSWSQGVDVWGESGMKKLWSAANIKVYGGGVSETQFLEDLSRLVGDFDRIASSTSTNRGQRTVSQQLQRERILDVADLGAMPKGRALVIGSGSRPTLIRTQPWMTSRYAPQIKASIAAHDPRAPQTLTDAEQTIAHLTGQLEHAS
jgi:type IV secretory pathway TraG/TraD family ATPase VirD4